MAGCGLVGGGVRVACVIEGYLLHTTSEHSFNQSRLPGALRSATDPTPSPIFPHPCEPHRSHLGPNRPPGHCDRSTLLRSTSARPLPHLRSSRLTNGSALDRWESIMRHACANVCGVGCSTGCRPQSRLNWATAARPHGFGRDSTDPCCWPSHAKPNSQPSTLQPSVSPPSHHPSSTSSNDRTQCPSPRNWPGAWRRRGGGCSRPPPCTSSGVVCSVWWRGGWPRRRRRR